MSAPTATLFTFRQIPVIAEICASRGVDVAQLLAEHELPETALRGEITAPLAKIEAFVDRCAEATRMPLFGLELAGQIAKGAFGVTEFIARAAPTIKHALAALCEFSPLVNPLLDMRYVAEPRGAEIRFSFAALRDALGTHLNEFTVAFISRQFAGSLGAPLPLERAWFAHARREHADAVAHRLGCTVSFQAADCGFTASSEILARAPAGADPALFAFLIAQARTQLAQRGPQDIRAQVIRAIEARLDGGDLGAAAIAEAMSTTARSLQRHLADAGTTYREVLAHVRSRRRAELASAGLAEAEIATRLGFAHARSMRRSLDGDDDGDA